MEIIKKAIGFFRESWRGQPVSDARAARIRQVFAFYEESGCLFIHIPKTAGVSVHEALFGRDSFGHYEARAYREILGRSRYKRLRSFCFVRNPYDRLTSAYAYLAGGGRGYALDLQYQEFLAPYKNFEQFVQCFLATPLCQSMEHFRPQSDWICSKRRKLIVNDVWKYEELQNDFSTVAELLGKPGLHLPRRNVTQRPKDGKDTLQYNQQMIDIVDAVYAEDFSRFHYGNRKK